jgi:putative MFS transporter
MGWLSAMWYVGATTAAVVGFFLSEVPGGWRWMLGSAALPGIILLLGRWGIPESPRWLASKGRTEEADAIIRDLFGEQVTLDDVPVSKAKYSTIFTQGYLRRFIFVCLMCVAQVVPMFAIYTFGPQILGEFGLGSERLSILGEAGISLFFILGTIPAMFWLNTMGRRRMLIGGLSVMGAALAVLGLWAGAPIGVVVAAFAIYAFACGGPGILQWLYPNELFPTEIRASAVGLVIAVTRIGTIASTYMLPSFLADHGISAVMAVGVGVTLVGLIATIILAPETKDQSLVESSVIAP